MEEFVNLKQGNMSVEEYSLKFFMLSRFHTSLVCNLRDEMSRFLTGVADIVKEEWRTPCYMIIGPDLESWFMMNQLRRLNFV